MMKRLAGAVSAAVLSMFPTFALGQTSAAGDPLGALRLRPGEPIVVGIYLTLSGADSALGIDQRRAIEIATDDWKGQVAGHPIRLAVEDAQCSAEGGQTAATKLASNQKVAVVVGPDCSSAAAAGAPILWKAGIASVGTTTTAPSLTIPNRPAGLHGFVRACYNDLAAGEADAKYFRNQMKCDSVVTVHDGSNFSEQIATVVQRRFTEMGGRVVSSEAVSPTDVDMRPLLTKIAASKPCVVFMPVFIAAAAQIARQAKNFPGLENTRFIGGSTLLAPGFLEAARDAAVGLRFTNIDTSVDAFSPDYPRFLQKYREKFGESPIAAFHANAYDAYTMALRGIEKVAAKDPQGNTVIGRKALRDALFATTGMKGLSSDINCTPEGDCAQYKGAVYEFVNGDPNSFKIGENPKKIFP